MVTIMIINTLYYYPHFIHLLFYCLKPYDNSHDSHNIPLYPN